MYDEMKGDIDFDIIIKSFPSISISYQRQNCVHKNCGTNLFSSMAKKPLISPGLEPGLGYTKKSCIAWNYRQKQDKNQ